MKDPECGAAGAGLLCRSCGHRLSQVFVDLGASPLCQKHLDAGQLFEMEPFYPLRVFVCDQCFLVQVEESASPETLFTSTRISPRTPTPGCSTATRTRRRSASASASDAASQVVEVASNDGYLLQYFVGARGSGAGHRAGPERRGGRTRARHPTRIGVLRGGDGAPPGRVRGSRADLLIGNNVLAHVPDINDFVARPLPAPEARRA